MLCDQVRRVWGLLVDNLALSMGCLFRCFRVRETDGAQNPRLAVSEPAKAKDHLASRNQLSSLLLIEEQSSQVERGSELTDKNGGRDLEEVDLKDEAKFLKACGTLLQTPPEIRNASGKKGSLDGDDLSSRFDSWFSGASCRQLNTVDPPGPATSSPVALPNGLIKLPMEEERQRLEDKKTAAPDLTLRSFPPEDYEEKRINQSRIRSVRFECDTSPNLNNSGHHIGLAFDSPGSEDNKPKLPGKRHSPNPTPLVLSSEMQTPGTVYPTKMDSFGNGKNSWVRSQYIYPVQTMESLSQCNALKDGTTDQSTKLEEVSSGLSGSGKRFDLERPIIGGVAAYWDDSDHIQISPKQWDGNGIPNSTTKYKEDQRVNWHATPFEERLEKALSEERLHPRNVDGLAICYEGEESDTAASFAARSDIAV